MTTTGPSYDTTVVRDPTAGGGHRIWFARGAWWAVLTTSASTGQRIYRRDESDHSWVDTGTLVDVRPVPFVDVVAEGDLIHVLSGGPRMQPSHHVQYSSFRFDPAISRYGLSPNMPVLVSPGGVRSLSLALDSMGRAWAALTTSDALEVARSSVDGLTWNRSSPIASGSIGSADVARIIRTANSVAVTWTDSESGTIWFATASSGSADQVTWGEPLAVAQLPLPPEPDLAAMSTPEGMPILAMRVLGGRRDPDVMALLQDDEGAWHEAVFSLGQDDHGPPAVAFDEAEGVVVVAAAAPARGDSVYYKTARPANFRFAAGLGIPLIESPGTSVSSAPQLPAEPFDRDSGLVALAADGSAGRYLTGRLDVGESGVPSSTVPSTAANPVLQLLVDDRFPALGPGDPLPASWSLAAGARADLVASSAGTVAHLRTTVAGPDRICRAFDHLASGEVRVRLVTRALKQAPEDATVLSVRAHGAVVFEARFGSDGAFAYSNGDQKVRTGVAYELGTWYLFEAVIDEQGTTAFAIQADPPGGPDLLGANGVAAKEAPAGALDRVCSGSAATAVRSTVEIMSLRIEETAP